MKNSDNSLSKIIFALTLVFAIGGISFCAEPSKPGSAKMSWMPGFPMRIEKNVMLMWEHASGAQAYNIYRNDREDGIGALLATVSQNNYMDMTSNLEKDNYYSIKFVAGGIESEETLKAKKRAAIIPESPKWSGYMPGESGDGEVILFFDEVEGAARYNVYKSNATDGKYELVGGASNGYFYGLQEYGKTFYYKIDAVGRDKLTSPMSETMEVTLIKPKFIIHYKRLPDAQKVIKTLQPPTCFDGSEAGVKFSMPRSIVADETKKIFYALDEDRITAWSLDKRLLCEFKSEKPGKALDINISPDGRILAAVFSSSPYVRLWDAESGHLLREFDMVRPSREEYLSYGRAGDWKKQGELPLKPISVCVEMAGKIWVFENSYRQLHVYESQGSLIGKLGEPRKLVIGKEDFGKIKRMRYSSIGDLIYMASVDLNYKTIVFDAKDIKPVEMKFPTGEVGYDYSNFFSPDEIAVVDNGDIISNNYDDFSVWDSAIKYRFSFKDSPPDQNLQCGRSYPLPGVFDVIGNTVIIGGEYYDPKDKNSHLGIIMANIPQ